MKLGDFCGACYMNTKENCGHDSNHFKMDHEIKIGLFLRYLLKMIYLCTLYLF